MEEHEFGHCCSKQEWNKARVLTLVPVVNTCKHSTQADLMSYTLPLTLQTVRQVTGSNLTCSISLLKSAISLAVKVSALLMTGTTAHSLLMADIMIQSVRWARGGGAAIKGRGQAWGESRCDHLWLQVQLQTASYLPNHDLSVCGERRT